MKPDAAPAHSAASFSERVAAVSCCSSCRLSGGQELRMRLKNLLCVPFSFSNRGSHVVVHEPEQVYDKSLTVRAI